MAIDAFKADDMWPTNRWFNTLLARARRGTLVSTGPGIERSSGGGLSRLRVPEMWALIGGSSPAYSFQEATPNASGGFNLVPGGRTDVSGKQPAYELNGVTGLAGTYQRLRFSTVNDWRFQERRYGGSGGGGSGTTTTLPDCTCANTPITLTMTSCNTVVDGNMFQNCTIQWQPIPAWASSFGLGDGENAYISTTSFMDPVSMEPFYYVLTCRLNEWDLSRIYQHYPLTTPPGNAFKDVILWHWYIGTPPNVCATDELALCLGGGFPGIDPAACVAIYGGTGSCSECQASNPTSGETSVIC